MTRIVVGVDGSDGSERALEWALDEAALRDARVDVVHAWDLPPAAYSAIPPMLPPMLFDTTALEQAAQRLLDDTVAAAHRPGLTIEKILVRGGAASALLETAQGAALVVVGSRGRGGFTGLLLGSVSQAISHHAPCPAVIVRG